jgi:nicotinamidase-related amidase
MPDLELDHAKTAILCLDVQNFTTMHLPDAAKQQLFGNIRKALDGARKLDVTVIYVVAARRPDFSSSRNKFISARAAGAAAPNPAEAAQRMKIADAVAPVGDEPIVRKPRMSAFYGSELQTMLSARDIDTVVLTGVATNFVVESTARYASDLDYRVVVLEDCCTAGSDEAHKRALASMEPLAHIMTSTDWLASIR